MKTYEQLTEKEKQIYNVIDNAADAEIDATNHLRTEGQRLDPETLPACNAYRKIKKILLED